jgi:hypothetical protein
MLEDAQRKLEETKRALEAMQQKQPQPAEVAQPAPPPVAPDPSVGGKYRNLLRRIEVEQDKNGYGVFSDYGYYTGTSYAGYNDLPVGYWVYVYPHWYIWGEAASK